MSQPSKARTILPWILYLWMAAVLIGAFFFAPLGKDFLGQSSRILFFHVPMAWVSFTAFLMAGVWSTLFLLKGRQPTHDRKAEAAVELGLVFCILATVTGAMWAKTMWGAFWNWDPRQVWITVALVYYGAYLSLRSSLPDLGTARRLAAAYGVLGLIAAPYFFFIAPRQAKFSLHPEPVVNAQASIQMNSKMLMVLIASALGFTVLFFWMHGMRVRLLALREQRIEEAR